jgi:hypothetical protein
MGILLAERRLSRHDLAEREKISLATARRLRLIRCNGVQLESFKIRLRRYTTRTALDRFISTAAAASPQPAGAA